MSDRPIIMDELRRMSKRVGELEAALLEIAAFAADRGPDDDIYRDMVKRALRNGLKVQRRKRR